LKGQALNEANNNEKTAKELYRKKISELRNQLIRDYAVAQTTKPLPALRVDLNEKLPTFNPTPLLELEKESPRLRSLLSDDPSTIENLKSPKKKLASTSNPKDMLAAILREPSDNPQEAFIQKHLANALTQLIAEQDKYQKLDQGLQEGPVSRVDPDWKILQGMDPEVASTLENTIVSLRKLYSPVSAVEPPALADKQIQFLLAVQKKLDKHRLQHSDDLIHEIKAILKYFEDVDNFYKELHELRLQDDISKISPEANEEYVKHLLNQNWTYAGDVKSPLL